MSLIRDIFGPSQEEIWTQFADEIGAVYENRGILKSKRVMANYDKWVVTFDTFARSTGKSSTTYTRIRAPFVYKDDLSFKIYKKSFFSDIGKSFGMQHIDSGFPDLDEKFIIKGNDETKIREILLSDKIREIIITQNRFRLEVKDDDGWLGTEIPHDVNLLHFEAVGVIKDIQILKSLYMLFVLVLNKLYLMGSIQEGSPEIKFK